ADPRPAAAQCDRSKLAGRGYIECLEKALFDADAALTEANRRAHTAVDARSDLAPTQRTRWKNMLDEAHGLFVRFRNFECQNVAPYEGGSRIGSFEERLACLVDKNLESYASGRITQKVCAIIRRAAKRTDAHLLKFNM